MKSIFKVSWPHSLAFAVSSHAADKLVVATDTAFVPLSSNKATNTSVSTSTCGPPSPKS